VHTFNILAVPLVHSPSEASQLLCRYPICALSAKDLIALEVTHPGWNYVCGNTFQFEPQTLHSRFYSGRRELCIEVCCVSRQV